MQRQWPEPGQTWLSLISNHEVNGRRMLPPSPLIAILNGLKDHGSRTGGYARNSGQRNISLNDLHDGLRNRWSARGRRGQCREVSNASGSMPSGSPQKGQSHVQTMHTLGRNGHAINNPSASWPSRGAKSDNQTNLRRVIGIQKTSKRGPAG